MLVGPRQGGECQPQARKKDPVTDTRDPTQPADHGGTAASATVPVLLYDGVCGFCNGAVQTILRLDPRWR